jgi:hypothetical protein
MEIGRFVNRWYDFERDGDVQGRVLEAVGSRSIGAVSVAVRELCWKVED